MFVNISHYIICITIIVFLYYLNLPPPLVLIKNKKKHKNITCCNECIHK